MCPYVFNLSIGLSVYPSIHPCVCPSITLSVCMSVCPPIHLFFIVSVFMPVFPSLPSFLLSFYPICSCARLPMRLSMRPYMRPFLLLTVPSFVLLSVSGYVRPSVHLFVPSPICSSVRSFIHKIFIHLPDPLTIRISCLYKNTR